MAACSEPKGITQCATTEHFAVIFSAKDILPKCNAVSCPTKSSTLHAGSCLSVDCTVELGDSV